MYNLVPKAEFEPTYQFIDDYTKSGIFYHQGELINANQDNRRFRAPEDTKKVLTISDSNLLLLIEENSVRVEPLRPDFFYPDPILHPENLEIYLKSLRNYLFTRSYEDFRDLVQYLVLASKKVVRNKVLKSKRATKTIHKEIADQFANLLPLIKQKGYFEQRAELEAEAKQFIKKLNEEIELVVSLPRPTSEQIDTSTLPRPTNETA